MSEPNTPADLFAEKTDAELLYLAQHAQHYPEAVGQSAIRELQRRGLIPDVSAGTPVPQAAPSIPTADATIGSTLLGVFGFREGYRVTPLLLWLNLIGYALLALAGQNFWQPAAAT
ncbi:hypothetical protein, partial [Thermocatellispora tengchongensis]|uniref:hypothetical protein n=1 Tax=Thermocatellispora tengchongensis TaxID=1073253 RepID=UPI0031E98CA7